MLTTKSERLSPCSARRDDRAPCIAWALCGFGALLLGGSTFAQSLVNGGVVRGNIREPGQRDVYSFHVRRGDKFEMRLVDVDASAFSPQLELYDTAGVLVATKTSPDVAVIDTTNAFFAGTYKVAVSHDSSARSQAGAYDLHFVSVPGVNAEELLDGLTVFGELGRGDLDSFKFTTAAGQRYEMTVTRSYGSPLSLRAEMFGANSSYSVGSGVTISFSGTSNQAQTYTLVLSDGSSTATGSGRYSIVVHGIPAAPPYPPSIFWPSEFPNDPLLMDNAGNSGLGPKIGDANEPFNFSIDCTGADSPSMYALWLTMGMQSAASTPQGLLYLSGPRVLKKLGRHTRSVETWFPEPTGFPIPNDVSLVGMTYTVQGACGGIHGSLRLSEAITQSIGH